MLVNELGVDVSDLSICSAVSASKLVQWPHTPMARFIWQGKFKTNALTYVHATGLAQSRGAGSYRSHEQPG
jgi:hypothetical protein